MMLLMNKRVKKAPRVNNEQYYGMAEPKKGKNAEPDGDRLPKAVNFG